MALTRTHDRLRLASLDGSLKRRGEVLDLVSGRHVHGDLLPRLRGETLEVVVEAARAYIVAVSITRLGVCVCVGGTVAAAAHSQVLGGGDRLEERQLPSTAVDDALQRWNVVGAVLGADERLLRDHFLPSPPAPARTGVVAHGHKI